jgi:hypothetical protein
MDMQIAIDSALATRTDDKHDYLFTWKPERWPIEELRKRVDQFGSTGIAEEPWSCSNRKIKVGDRAYLLKQGRPIGIFGRGTVVAPPEKKQRVTPGESSWEVRIGFAISRSDVLWDPGDSGGHFLVDEEQLLDVPAPKNRWKARAAGIRLEADAAREIDRIITISVLIGRGRSTPVDEAVQEIARLKRQVEQATRPDQQAFRGKIRRNYQDKCAVTAYATPAAFEAAHISTRKGSDDNSAANGILLRSDIHALFDSFLITLSEDGAAIEVSSELKDPSYRFLRTAVVTRPNNEPPSKENIQEHRKLFFERQKWRSGIHD